MASRPRITAARVLAGIACAMLLPAASQASAPGHRAPHFSSHAAIRTVRHGAVPGELIVRFAPRVGAHRRAHVARAAGVRLSHWLGTRGLWLVRVRGTGSVDRATRVLRRSPGVRWAERNHYVSLDATTPDDPLFAQDWGLDNTGQVVQGVTGTADADIDAPEAWDQTTGSTNVVVAVVDTGVDYTHQDLASNIWTNPGETGGGKESNGIDDDGNGYVDDWHGWNFGLGTNDPIDAVGHGTHVAGTIGAAGDNGTGVTGVNWNVQIMPLRVADANGTLSDAAVAAAFAYAGRMGARVVNASLGGSYTSSAELAAINGAPDTLFVVSAGNSNQNIKSVPISPCTLPAPNIICVGATASSDKRASFSNYAPTQVDIAAPGVTILSTLPGDQFGYYSGTSMASPHVAGVAALVLAAYPARSVEAVEAAILNGADRKSGLSTYFAGGRRLNAAGAVAVAAIPPPDLTLASPSSLTSTGVALNATVNPHGRAATWLFNWGTTSAYGSHTSPRSTVVSSSNLPVTATLSGLIPNQTYHYQLVVTTLSGVATSDDATYATPGTAPIVTTGSAYWTYGTQALVAGTANPRNAATTYWFEYGPTIAYGSETDDLPLDGGVKAASVYGNLPGLSSHTTYHFRLVAENAFGTSYGPDRSFTTPSL
jgi:subtilisin family serine protease